jgi:hypothetical protein
MTYDSAAWGALAFALSVLLGVVTFFRWRRSGLVAGARGAAWTILPVAAWLTGVLELGFDVADSVGRWAVHLVFSPVVWLGVVLAGVSAVLFGVSAVLGNRGHRAVAGSGTPPPALDPRSAGRRRGSDAVAGDDDLGDIEAILRKHGIS